MKEMSVGIGGRKHTKKQKKAIENRNQTIVYNNTHKQTPELKNDQKTTRISTTRTRYPLQHKKLKRNQGKEGKRGEEGGWGVNKKKKNGKKEHQKITRMTEDRTSKECIIL